MMSSGQMLKMVVQGGACGRGHGRGVELILLLPCFQNFSSDVAMLVFQMEKLAFSKRTTKALLKPHIELVALVTLRVSPVLTVALFNFYSPSRGLLRDGGVFFGGIDW